ncbi:unnamed protein product, partial [Musa acuminata subsp. burmannicoides]
MTGGGITWPNGSGDVMRYRQLLRRRRPPPASSGLQTHVGTPKQGATFHPPLSPLTQIKNVRAS